MNHEVLKKRLHCLEKRAAAWKTIAKSQKKKPKKTNLLALVVDVAQTLLDQAKKSGKPITFEDVCARIVEVSKTMKGE